MIENVWHNTVILCLVFQSINLKKAKDLKWHFSEDIGKDVLHQCDGSYSLSTWQVQQSPWK